MTLSAAWLDLRMWRCNYWDEDEVTALKFISQTSPVPSSYVESLQLQIPLS